MDEHRLACACVYIKDFIYLHLNCELMVNIGEFVNDRFSECSEEKKVMLYKTFKELSEKISSDKKLLPDTYNTASDLLEVLW